MKSKTRVRSKPGNMEAKNSLDLTNKWHGKTSQLDKGTTEYKQKNV